MATNKEINASQHHTQRLPLVLSLSQAAREYGFDRGTLSEAIRRGELEASCPTPGHGYRKYRIRRTDIEAWLQRHRVQPDGASTERASDPVVRKRLEREHRRNR